MQLVEQHIIKPTHKDYNKKLARLKSILEIKQEDQEVNSKEK